MVELSPMSPEEYARFIESSTREFAEKEVRSGSWAPEGAAARARAEYAKLLPNGLDTPDHTIRNVLAGPSGEVVGTVWWAIRREPGATELFVYWIGIDEPHRRHGYASEVFGRLEEEAARAGASRITLHVFGANVAARAFYEKLGFEAAHLLLVRPVALRPIGPS